MSTTATNEKVVDPQAGREYARGLELMVQARDWERLPEEAKGKVMACAAAVNGFLAKANDVITSSKYSASGVYEALQELQPQRALVAKAIEREEAEIAAALSEVHTARERIERGELMRGADKRFYVVERPTPTTLTEIRASEIRRDLRGLPKSEARGIVLAAFDNDDREVLYAIETAPRSMPVVDQNVMRDIAARRWARAGWEHDYQAKLDDITPRRLMAQRARRALAIDD